MSPERGAEAEVHSNHGGDIEPERIPRIAPGWDPQGISLSPAEGFLLSRIDGATSWRALREIGGVSPGDVDRALERWAKEGVILVEVACATAPGADAGSADDRLDASLDLPLDFQARVLEFEAGLERPYHELLGVEHDADAKEIKRAYFGLSKEYHPDRYFRRNLGAYAERLDRVFKKVAEAYELLSDPTTRAEIERSMAGPAAGGYRASGVGGAERIGPVPTGRRVPTRIENLERLRARFKIPKKLVAERQFKARQFYQSALVAAKQQRWLEAAAGMRLAIAFDPWSAEYKTGFAEIQADVQRARADELIELAVDQSTQAEALRLLEEAIHYRPGDALANARAAALCLELDQAERAREFADSAAQLAPDAAENHALLARTCRRTGDRAAAAAALARAIELDDGHPDVVAEQKLQSRGGMRTR
jgi:tetratricopeptide (TPR) repeat protein